MKTKFFVLGFLFCLLTFQNLNASSVEVHAGFLSVGVVNQVTASLTLFQKVNRHEDWYFLGDGADIIRISVFTDGDLLKSYGPNWAGLMGIPSIVALKMGVGWDDASGKDPRPDWMRSLFYLIGAPLFYLGFLQMPLHLRVEAGIPFVHLAAGMDTDLYLWSQKAIVFRPWAGIVLQAESDRGLFSKGITTSYLPFLEAKILHTWCFGDGILPTRLHNKSGFQIQAGLTL